MEIDYKEKYEQAIWKLRGMIPNWERLSYNGKTFLQDLIHIFPELKESEDEKIRKALIQLVKKAGEGYENVSEGISIQKAIAWLEKQGKQKQEVEGNPNARKPTLRIVKGKSYLCIKDYRDKNCTFTKGKIYESDKDGFLVDDEEKNTFERKIWEEDAIEYFFLFEQSKTKDVITDEKQKPAWSEEDTQYINDTLALLSFGVSTHSIGEVQEWLQSLNNRVQLKQEWSEEDEKTIDEAVEYIEKYAEYVQGGNSKQYVLDLASRIESLRPQNRWKPSDEQIEALEKMLKYFHMSNAHGETIDRLKELLEQLLEQLKKHYL